MMASLSFFTAGGFGAYLIIFAIIVFYAVRKFGFSRTKLIPSVPVIGLEQSKRTLKQARHDFMYHGGEMVKEGYEEVVLVEIS